MATVSTSRFAALHVEDIDDSDNEEQSLAKKEDKPTMSNSAKKRARKKKKSQQIQSENAQLRDLAFSKLPPKVPGSSGAPGSSNSGKDKKRTNGPQWDEWSQKDKEYVSGQYEKDLEKAIMQSKLEFEQQSAFYDNDEEIEDVGPASGDKINRKERRKHLQKDKPTTITLQQLHSGMGLDQILQPAVVQTQPKAKKSPALPEGDEFFHQVDKDVEKLLHREERDQFRKANEKFAAESVRKVQFDDILSKRDEEIRELQENNAKLKEELQMVKKRNKQLCFILAQGEMKEKAIILKQVDELTSVKDELTQQVSELHTSLEQERSKVSALRNEVQKYQHHHPHHHQDKKK
ncbi:G kinase-anchoring protein 1-B-like [Glandiceps talaboti]